MSERENNIAIKISQIKSLPELQPKKDQIFKHLFDDGFDGKVPTYFATVPMRLIHPFDSNFLPQEHPNGRAAIHLAAELIRSNKAPIPWVYPQRGIFVLSDDYIAYEAYRLVGEPFLPCFILGNAFEPGVNVIDGPLDVEEVQEAMYSLRIWAEREE